MKNKYSVIIIVSCFLLGLLWDWNNLRPRDYCRDAVDANLYKEKMAVYDGQKEIAVSQPEYRILQILMENKGKTVTRNQLLEQVWDCSGNYVNDNTLTVTMKRLREKLNHPACLKTIRSFGYRMEDTQ